jgi:hypothetical protein
MDLGYYSDDGVCTYRYKYRYLVLTTELYCCYLLRIVIQHVLWTWMMSVNSKTNRKQWMVQDRPILRVGCTINVHVHFLPRTGLQYVSTCKLSMTGTNPLLLLHSGEIQWVFRTDSKSFAGGEQLGHRAEHSALWPSYIAPGLIYRAELKLNSALWPSRPLVCP